MGNDETLHNRKRVWRWLGPLVFIVAVAIAAWLFFADSEPQSPTFTPLQAVPANSLLVVNVDRTTADLPQLATLWHTFVAATADFEPPLNTPFQTIGKWQADANINLVADVIPWLGDDISLALLSGADDWATTEWLLAAASTDEAAADAFVRKIAASNLFAARSANLVLLASSETAVQQASATLNNSAIANEPAYAQAIASLPTGHPFTIYIAGEQIRPLANSIWSQTALATFPLPQLLNTDHLQSLALAITPTSKGLQIDSTALYTPDQPLTPWLTATQTNLAPTNTVAYLSGNGLNLLWDRYLATDNQADLLESFQIMGDQFGLHPSRDLFAHLDGETAVILTPSRSGTAAQTLRLNLGATLLASSSQADILAANLATFTTAISNPQLGLATVQATAVHNIPLNQIETSLLPGLSLVYGLGKQNLLLSTSAESIGELAFDGGPTLAENPDFQAAQTALGQSPALFINIAQLMDIVGSSVIVLARAIEFQRETAVLQPLHLLAISTSQSENQVRYKAVIFINRDQ